MGAKTQLQRALGLVTLVPLTLGCGAGDSARGQPPERDASWSEQPETCIGARCCPDIEWMLITPVKTGLGGAVDLDASVRRSAGQRLDVRWAVEGGGVDRATAPQARYTCRREGVFKVSFSATTPFCETSQEAHIQCAK